MPDSTCDEGAPMCWFRSSFQDHDLLAALDTLTSAERFTLLKSARGASFGEIGAELGRTVDEVAKLLAGAMFKVDVFVSSNGHDADVSRRPNAWNVAGMRHYRRRRTARRIMTPVVVLVIAAAVGLLVGVAPAINGPAAASAPVVYAEPINGCEATDGDTLRCGSERVRLLAIDAPELPGHCREGRVCAPGDPYASTSSLADAMTGQLTIARVGQDHYGRTLALVAGSKGDLSCWQLARGQGIYKSAWDNGLRVARACPAAVAGL